MAVGKEYIGYDSLDFVLFQTMESEQPLHPQQPEQNPTNSDYDWLLTARQTERVRAKRLTILLSRAPRQLSGVR